jgi:PTH1 family peptidyl-tRNA hydrolase
VKPHLVIIGLGNPGKQYERTRHNAGFLAIDVLSEAFGEGTWKEQPKFLCSAQEARILMAGILLVKPSTFMNRSGECARKLVDYYKLDTQSQILVLSDDIDIPLGEIRLRMKGGPGTHNGLRSITEQFGEDYPRIRIGIGGNHPKGEELATWVLSALPSENAKTLEDALSALPELVRKFVLERPEAETK